MVEQGKPMLADIPRDAWHPEIEGWSEDILPYYRHLADGLPSGARFVEVGVAHGRSLLFLAEELYRLGRHDVELYAVDFWPGDLFRTMILPQLQRADLAHLVAMINWVRADGVRAAALFEPYSVDVCFIDSDHTLEGMRRHLEAWSPKIRSGGILAGHDYHTIDWPGVVQAVDEAFGAAGAGTTIGRPTRTVWEVRFPQHGDLG